MDEDTSLTNQVESARRAVSDWSDATDPTTLIVGLACIGLVVLFRRKLAEGFVSLIFSVMRRLSAKLSEEVRAKLVDAAEVLMVAFACYIALEIVNPPELAGGFTRRLISSVAVIAVFTAWYRLAGPFISLLRNEQLGQLRVEQDWMIRVTQFAILLFGLTSLLNVWEIDISGALTGVGVLGAGLAIAAQDLVRNLIAGMSNLSEDRFETGDAIEVPDLLMGTVERIDLRSTLILGFDQIPRHIPNSDLANSVVLNFSRMKHRRLWVEIPLLLSTSAEQVTRIKDGLEDFVQSSGLFDTGADAPKYIYASNISDHAVEILFVARTVKRGYEDMLIAKEALNIRVLELVEEAGTALAYPTKTIQTVPKDV